MSGLVAGCGFAKDCLRLRLLQTRQLHLSALIRDYVDDVVVFRVMPDASAIPDSQADLQRLRAWCQTVGLKVSPTKEQLLIFSKQHQRLWRSFEPEAAEILTHQAKDLGIYPRRGCAKSDGRPAGLQDLQLIARRVSALQTPANRRRDTCIGLLWARGLYGPISTRLLKSSTVTCDAPC